MHSDTEGPAGLPGEDQSPPGYEQLPGYGQPPGYGPPPGYAAPPGYGPPPGYAAPPGYGVPPYGSASHGTPGYGAPGYGTPGYGAPGYGTPGDGQPYPAAYPPPPGYGYGWNGPLATTWPYGPGRPGVATAAAVLGFVTAGLTLLMQPAFLGALLGGDGDAATAVLLLGIPCAAGLIAGGVQLLRRRSSQLLLVSAIAAVLVLLVALVAALATSAPSADDFAGAVVLLVFAGALPVTTAVLAGQRTVTSWTAAAPT